MPLSYVYIIHLSFLLQTILIFPFMLMPTPGPNMLIHPTALFFMLLSENIPGSDLNANADAAKKDQTSLPIYGGIVHS